MRIGKFTELSSQAADAAELVAIYKRALYDLGFRIPGTRRAPLARNTLEHAELLFRQFHVAFLGLNGKQEPVPSVSLSDREREVLHWSARGLKMPAIARTLGLSVHGVDYHMRNILRKLDAHGIGYALSKAQHLGLIKFKPAAVRKKGTRKLAVKRGRDRQQRRAHFASLLKK
jgi:DNA-binding CsgD family transcriptional regulator